MCADTDRIHVVWALDAIGGSHIVEPLLAVVEAHYPEALSIHALRALGRVGSPKSIMPLVDLTNGLSGYATSDSDMLLDTLYRILKKSAHEADIEGLRAAANVQSFFRTIHFYDGEYTSRDEEDGGPLL